jgi:hypothetical protein
MFIGGSVSGDPLAWLDKTHDILIGMLLITISISLFVVAWTGRPISALSTNSTTIGKLFAYAYCAAVGAFMLGLFLVRATIEHFDVRYLTGMVLSGAYCASVVCWTRFTVLRLANSETAKKHAGQFLWSCLFFSLLSFVFGMAVTGVILNSGDFMRIFGAVCFGAFTCVGIYPILRDAKGFADAVGRSQIASGQTDEGST